MLGSAEVWHDAGIPRARGVLIKGITEGFLEALLIFDMSLQGWVEIFGCR